MSVQNEINRLSEAKSAIRSSIIEKGVDVPEQASITEYQAYIQNIQQQADYSTTAIDTGKKWIDGKPVYRKVINFNLSASEQDIWSTNIDIGDTIDTFVYVSTFIDIDGTKSSQFLVNGVTTNKQVENQNTITITAYDKSYSNQQGYAILEYTRQ